MKAMTPHVPKALRVVLTGGVLTGVALTGLAVPAQAATTADCSSFKRVSVISKREILNPVASGELRNGTSETQMLVIERSIIDKRTTSKEFRTEWKLFEGAFTAGVSRSVVEEHTISGVQQARISVPARRVVAVTGSIRTWRVESEVTTRNSNCSYSTRRVTGDVATTDDMVWNPRDIGPA
ncbi:hypothetical protein [Streptomyces geranii]|uniref:hypothetical protein n=1 Tax=Streptomyces geranii TaxID=2058923 RepID=UPI000D032E01|nr:hypothetical protein [Streptomyces geranii]